MKISGNNPALTRKTEEKKTPPVKEEALKEPVDKMEFEGSNAAKNIAGDFIEKQLRLQKIAMEEAFTQIKESEETTEREKTIAEIGLSVNEMNLSIKNMVKVSQTLMNAVANPMLNPVDPLLEDNIRIDNEDKRKSLSAMTDRLNREWAQFAYGDRH